MSFRTEAIKQLRLRSQRVILSESFDALPGLFALYASLYELGREKEFLVLLEILAKKEKDIKQIRWISPLESNPWVTYGDRLIYMNTLQEVEIELRDLKEDVEDWHKRGMIKIGHTNSDVLLLGVNKNVKDKIYLYGQSLEFSEFRFLDSDIFTFFSKLYLVPDQQVADYLGIILKNIVKSWGEDFYREL